MNQESNSPALIATLGLQPQVITRSLDILLADIEPELGELVLVHTAAWSHKSPHWDSLASFKRYLEQTYPQLQVRLTPILDEEGQPARDVETPEMAAQVFRIIFREVKGLKKRGRRLHGLIAGGRKSMIVYTMVSAQILFDMEDRLWHLFSRDEGTPLVNQGAASHLQGAAPHLTGDSRRLSRLLEIPIFHLAGFMPMVRGIILDNDDPMAAVNLFREHENRERLLRLREFYNSRDKTDQTILRLTYRGFSNSEIGEQLYLHETTVSGRLGQIADLFFQQGIAMPPEPQPKNLRLALLHSMRPYLSKLVDD